MIRTTKERCICSSKTGYGCDALVEEDAGCLDGTCPFFKTECMQTTSERAARERCEKTGFTFKSRDEVMNEYEYKSKYDKRRRQKEKDAGVLQFNTLENEFIEYDSMASASKTLGIPLEKLKLIIKKGEEYHGYKYMLL